MKIKIYIEGGGDSHLQDTEFRAAWASFFEKAGLGALRKRPATFRGSSRTQTFDAYQTAVKTRKPDELPLLLVDSEDLVSSGHGAWQHLKARDGWEKPAGAGDEDVFLMICCMETWFLADRGSLKRFFHDCWRDSPAHCPNGRILRLWKSPWYSRPWSWLLQTAAKNGIPKARFRSIFSSQPIRPSWSKSAPMRNGFWIGFGRPESNQMNPQPTISAFSKFVFDKTTGNVRRGASAESFTFETWNGAISEENLKQYRAVAAQGRWSVDDPVRKWKVLHEGQAEDGLKKVFECRFLKIGGSPLRGSPDLVLQSDDDRKHKVILIVERKLRTAIDYAGVPDRSWPNVRAQLWSYAWITDWDWYKDSNVILMTEYYWRPFPSHGDAVYMGCRGVWNRGDSEFNRESKQHFLDYGGEIDSLLQIPE